MPEETHVLQAPPDAPRFVWFEPWAEGLRIPPNAEIELHVTAAIDGKLRIDELDQRTAIYGSPGCTLKVQFDGNIVREFDLPVPDVPMGMDTKAFVDFMFGPPPKPTDAERAPAKSRRWWRFWR